MKKIVVSSLLFFAVGAGAAALIVANPFHWGWAHAVQGRLGVAMAPMASDPAGPSGTSGTSSTAASTAGPRGTGERRILYWVAPMDPSYIRDAPGKSPMGMDLVPVYEDEVGGVPGLVRIDPVFVQNVGVRTEVAERADIPHTIRTVGTFTYDESQIYWINTKYEGWIENVGVNYVGEEVRAGQRLFDIFSPQLVNAQQEYLDALAYLERLDGSRYPEIVERARSLVEASRKRLGYWDVTDEQIAELEAMGEPRRTLRVVSPVRGVVVSKMDQALEGMLARPGMNLYQIVDLSSIWVEAEIFEDDIPWVDTGQGVTITVPHRPGQGYRGTIRYLYPFLDRSTRTLRLSIEMPNPDLEFRSDMFADVTMEVPSARDVITVPEEAVIRSGERNVVVIDVGSGTFQVREVELGLNGNGLWEVRNGIAAGDRVVVSSQFLIDSESNLREAIRKLVSEEPSTGETGTETDMNMEPETEMESDPGMRMPTGSDN